MPIPDTLRNDPRMFEGIGEIFPAVVVQIRQTKITVAFKTPRVLKKPPS
jgi:hypothetical protein